MLNMLDFFLQNYHGSLGSEVMMSAKMGFHYRVGVRAWIESVEKSEDHDR